MERLQLLQQTTATVSTEQGMGESDLTLGDSLEQSIEPSAMETMDQESFLDQVRPEPGDAQREGAHASSPCTSASNGHEPVTLEQIGQAFVPPISRERVRQIEERAFMKIRERRRVLLGQFLKGRATGQ